MKSFIPPIEVQANARRALEVRAQKAPSERGMLAEGLSRARDLSNGRAIPLDTIKRMYSFFERHEVDKQGSSWSTYGKGWQAWMGWGGDAGHRWVKRILARNSDFPSVTGSTNSGTSVEKAGPTQPPAAPPAAPAAGAPPADPNAPPVDPNAPPADPNAPPADPSAPPPISVEPLGEGKFRETNSGKEFAVEQKVPKDEDKVKNERDTKDYLESSGLKGARSALANLAVMATESVDHDAKTRLYNAGLLDLTDMGMQVSPFGARFLQIVDANKDIGSKEQDIKTILHFAERHAASRKSIPIQRAAGLDNDMQKSASFFNTTMMPLDDQWYLKDALQEVDVDDVTYIFKAFTKAAGSVLTQDESVLYENLVRAMDRLKADALRAGQDINTTEFSQKLGTEVTKTLSETMRDVYRPQIAQIVNNLGGEISVSQAGRMISREWNDYLVMRNKQLQESTQNYLSRYGKDETQAQGMDIAFGKRRAEIIAITEATNAKALVAKSSQIVLNKSGIKTRLIWQTAASEATCRQCSSLNNLAQGDGWTELPPLHPYCRCTVRVENA